MKAEISISQVYYNASLLNFFFRTQAENTFNELFESVEEENEDVFNAIEGYSDDLDEIEEMFYNDSIDEIISNLRLTAIEEEEEEEEEEN
jgi:hypothetical protein